MVDRRGVRPVSAVARGAASAGGDAHDGYFAPDSVTWSVHLDPVFAIAGVRALLLQALHPRTMLAVAQHGGFAEDYWGRLDRTSEYVSALTYGTVDEARRMAARVRGIHGKIRGTDPDTGETFRVDDPHLLLWVHCCEVESFLTTARRAGAPITAEQADRYYAEQVTAAELVGIPAEQVPASAAAMARYFERMRPELRLTDEAWYGLGKLVVPPMKAWVQLLTPARPAWATLTGVAFVMLPAWARKLYKSPGYRPTDLAATAALRALRVALQAVPDRWSGPPIVVEAKTRRRGVLEAAERSAG